MKRSISVRIGKGSVTHNSRKFYAENVDRERSGLNIEYCNENIKDVYHELFDEAVARYNAKQTRKDRCIDNYYEKIRTGKQEKLFHEVILQVGNMGDMSATSDDGKLAEKVLDEYMKEFQERNPTLRVFSAHLHMDEATPHLHIDFIPYITGSTRGVDTRVSLKQALGALGFKGGSRQDTELNQWINAEKEHLAEIMEKNEIEWDRLGTHEEHLSDVNFKKEKRLEEVAELEEQKASLIEENAGYEKIRDDLEEQISGMDGEIYEKDKRREQAEEQAVRAERKARAVQKELSVLTADMKQVEQYAAKYVHSPEEWLPEPNAMETAKSYRKRILPAFGKVVELLRPLYAAYTKLKENCEHLTERVTSLTKQVENLSGRLTRSNNENQELRGKLIDFDRIRKVLGDEVVDDAIREAKILEREQEIARKRKRQYSRDAR